MSQKPIFVATHPRACSTAFERVFMTCRDSLQCIHEPFGDAFYFGPERLGSRYEDDEEARLESGFSNSTYKTIFDRIDKEAAEGKRIFIKDITHYLVPPNGKPAMIAPSLTQPRRGIGTDGSHSPATDSSESGPGSTADSTTGDRYPFPTETEPGNPSVVPLELLRKFQFAFLIRHPRSSIPSYYRCTVPPLDEVTGFYNFLPEEAGYDELRRVFDYLKDQGLVGPRITGQSPPNEDPDKVDIVMIDADDLLDNPSGVVEAFCKSVGMEYSPDMLKWGDEIDQRECREKFDKWKGFHEDAINSTELKPRTHKKIPKSDEALFAEWTEKYGVRGATIIRDAVAKNVADYEYLKQFALKV
ncbi:hypothetical protein P152DRAFT_514874 [Eremomyces bilateralis CBS 781.70]|uniref:P-loop containing nucleoside triphosphate hydrolase protein n=1 Tax=Eremomyces bilateralis CBS 781.70 TaxID=1392243 RepID=A0A6G1G182_9PEZI|nr:uncharacterized protein P152DRAFT_514874 [Eremomyces bilateralis CBS 781.70]KAF1811742.1 hypothetical protein P152DRAFT_514874 [Eremomyces bilateralis CBS 781.70]